MAIVEPQILELLPDDVIVIHAHPGALGTSSEYTLVVILHIASVSQANVTLDLEIRDPALYLFADGSRRLRQNYPRRRDNDTVEFPFRIRNVVPLTGVPLRLVLKANDVSTPEVVIPTSASFHVRYGAALSTGGGMV